VEEHRDGVEVRAEHARGGDLVLETVEVLVGRLESVADGSRSQNTFAARAADGIFPGNNIVRNELRKFENLKNKPTVRRTSVSGRKNTSCSTIPSAF